MPNTKPLPTLLKPGNEVMPPAHKLVPMDYNMAASDFHHVKDGDHWKKIADDYEVPVQELLMWNFNTLDPYEINWYLRQYVGCNQTTPDKYNYRFSTVGADYRGPHTCRVYIPRMSIQVGEIPIPKPAPKPPEPAVTWTPIEFWVSGTIIDMIFSNRMQAGVMMRLKKKPDYCWMWPFNVTNFGWSANWSGGTDFSTTVNTFHVDLTRWDPRKLFTGLRIKSEMYSNKMNFTICDIFPWDVYGGKPTPVRNYFEPELKLSVITGNGVSNEHLGYNKSIWSYLGKMQEGPTPPSPGSVWA